MRSHDVLAVMAAHSDWMIWLHGINNADGLRLGHELLYISLAGPAECGHFVVCGQVAACDLAAED
jgi:hypothetical protein